MKKLVSILAVLLALAIFTTGVYAGTFKLGLDYRTKFSVADLFEVKKIPGLLMFDTLSISATFQENDLSLTVGMANFGADKLEKYIYDERTSYYLGIASNNFNLFVAKDESPVNQNDKVLEGFAKYSLYDSINASVERKMYNVIGGYDIAFPKINWFDGIAMYSAGIEAKYRSVGFSNYFGIFDYYTLYPSLYNPFVGDTDEYDPVGQTFRIMSNMTRLSLDVNEYIILGANLNLVDAKSGSSDAYRLGELSLDANIVLPNNLGKFTASLAGQINEISGISGKGFSASVGFYDLALVKNNSIRFGLDYTYLSKGNFHIFSEASSVGNSRDFISFPSNEVSFHKLGLTLSKTFEFSNNVFAMMIDNDLAFANWMDQDFLVDTTVFNAKLTLANKSTLAFNVDNFLVKNNATLPQTDLTNTTVFSILGKYNFTKNISLGVKYADVLKYSNNPASGVDIENIFGGDIFTVAKWDFNINDNLKTFVTLAGSFGGDSETKPNWYRFNAYTSVGLAYKGLDMNASFYAGDDKYSRLYTTRVAMAANFSIQYKIIPQVFVSGTVTWRNWQLGENIMDPNNFTNITTIESKIFGQVGIHFRPYKDCEINLTWGRTGLADPRVFDSVKEEEIMPWQTLSTLPTHTKMGLNIFELELRVKF